MYELHALKKGYKKCSEKQRFIRFQLVLKELQTSGLLVNKIRNFTFYSESQRSI